jgi:hypothetical protein
MSQYPPPGPPPPGGPPPGPGPQGGWGPQTQPSYGGPGGPGGPGPGGPGPGGANRLPVMLGGVLVAVVLVVGAVLLLGGDGGSGGGERQEYVEAIAATMESEGSPMSTSERECVAETVVDVMGLQAFRAEVSAEELASDPEVSLRDHGVVPDERQASDVYAGMTDCVDVRALMGETLTAQVGAELAGCVLEAVDDALLERLIVGSFVDGEEYLETDPELDRDFAAAVGPCEPDS